MYESISPWVSEGEPARLDTKSVYSLCYSPATHGQRTSHLPPRETHRCSEQAAE